MNQSSLFSIALGSIVVSGLLIWGISAMRGGDTPAAPVDVPPLAADDHVAGNRESAVVLVEYFDYECPACAAYAPIVKQLEAEYGDRVAFVHRYFPLPQHSNGRASAHAAEAAAQQGKYFEMHDLLFAQQQAWANKPTATPEVFAGYAQQLGLNMEQYTADVASAEVADRVERDAKDGQRIGVKSTPSFFLNGVPLKNVNSIEKFRARIDAELAK